MELPNMPPVGADQAAEVGKENIFNTASDRKKDENPFYLVRDFVIILVISLCCS